MRGGSLTGISHQQGRNKRREEEGKFFTSRMSGIRCSILMGCSCGTDRAGLVGRFPRSQATSHTPQASSIPTGPSWHPQDMGFGGSQRNSQLCRETEQKPTPQAALSSTPFPLGFHQQFSSELSQGWGAIHQHWENLHFEVGSQPCHHPPSVHQQGWFFGFFSAWLQGVVNTGLRDRMI